MAEESDSLDSSQSGIKFYLEAFLPYICENVRATDLLVHLPFFNKAERKEIFSLSTKRPSDATKLSIQILLKKDEPGIYRAIKEAMGPDQADIPKVYKILSGKFIPSIEEDNYNRIIELFMNEVLGRLPPTDIAEHLYHEHAISVAEKEEIEYEMRNRGRRQASWNLLFYLPQRVENWFKIFLKALIECEHKDLAQKLDPDLFTKITAQMQEGHSVGETGVSETKEDILEVFEDAVEDQALLDDVKEMSDLEKSEKESETNPKLSPQEVDNDDVHVFKNDLNDDLNTSTICKTEETYVKSTGDDQSIHMAELKEEFLRNDSEAESKDEPQAKYKFQYNSAENSNINRNQEAKPAYEKAFHSQTAVPGNQMPQKAEEETSISDPLLSAEGNKAREETAAKTDSTEEQIVRSKIVKPKGLRLRYDSNFLRRLQHTALASFPTQAFLRVPELFSRDSKSIETVKEFDGQSIVLDHYAAIGRSRNHQRPQGRKDVSAPDSKEGPSKNASVRAMQSEHINKDVSRLLFEESSVRGDQDRTSLNGTNDDTLTNLISSLENFKLLPDITPIYIRNQEGNGNEDINDLSKAGADFSVATDFDNIEDENEREINLREYQKELAEEGCQGENVIILAPTNSGKTWVACRIIQEHFRQSRGRRIAKCAFVVENTALALQQGICCAEQLSHLRTKVISGETQRDKKEYLRDFVDRRDILVVTAKVLQNTLQKKEIKSVTRFSLIVFDECHHTMSNHPYNEIMHLYHDAKRTVGVQPDELPQIVGLTASLGVGGEITIEKAAKHMQTLMANLDARSLCRVKKNVKELEKFMNTPYEEIIIVPRRENDSFRIAVGDVMKAIERLMSRTAGHLNPADLAIVNKIVKNIPASKGSQPYIQWLSGLEKGLAELQSDDMRRILNSCRLHLLNYNQAVLLYCDARVEDALEFLKEKMEPERTANIPIERIMLQIYDTLIKEEFKDCSFNPKLTKVQEILLDVLGKNDDARGIIFVKTRTLAHHLIKWMKDTLLLQPLNPTEFVGQNASVQVGGMTKHEQKDVLEYFKDGKHKLIVATSVAEEGLDITQCNLVIRYEHVTNEIVRTQSRGRARAANSRYFVITEEGSPIADKEEKNALAEELMNKTAAVLERNIVANRNNFEIQLNKLQLGAQLNRDMKEKRRKEKITAGDFEFRCFHCNQFICMSSDIRKIQGVHHVCIADDIRERVNFQRSPVPQFEESDMKMDGVTSCKVDNCQKPLGGVCDYKGIEFPLLKIQYFRLVDRNGKGSHTKKWKGAPCQIQELELEELVNFAHGNSDSD